MSLDFLGLHAEILADETGEIDVEGARMSGKTWLISAKVAKSCVRYPGIWWLINRYSGAETDNQLRPQFVQVCRRLGYDPEWNNDESAYWFPEKDGKVSKVFAYGLKTQSKDQRYAKIRGSGVAGVWNDQSEELPEDIATEIRALIRQPGYPHQLIFSPNPPNEDHFLADQFPEGDEIPGRKYYRLSLYDNRHNLSADTIEKLERAYPITHAKHKSLILGQRGPNIVGTPVYDGVFSRDHHIGVTDRQDGDLLLEAVHAGMHHPAWLAAQRSPMGGLQVLGAVVGKRMFLEDFLPIVQRYRMEWYEGDRPLRAKLCTDPPPADETGQAIARYSHVNVLREYGLQPVYRPGGNAPDVREAVIQHLAGQMRRRDGFMVNDDPSRWLMVSAAVTKQTKLFADSLEGSYVWDENLVSVANKKVRQPKTDPWLEGLMRCLENIALNFCAGFLSHDELTRRRAAAREQGIWEVSNSPHAWMM